MSSIVGGLVRLKLMSYIPFITSYWLSDEPIFFLCAPLVDIGVVLSLNLWQNHQPNFFVPGSYRLSLLHRGPTSRNPNNFIA